MLDALTLDQMRTFIAVAETGSFRAGATRVSRVQSAVSHTIANLEAELGVALFDRAGYRPALTPEGQALLEDARAVLIKVDSMRARARGLGEGVELGLSLVVDSLFPIATVAAALGDMRAIYPSVGIRMEVAPLGGPLSALRDGRATIGIIVGEEFRDTRIEVEALSSVALIAVAGSTHPLATSCEDGAALRAVDLADHLQIVLQDPTPVTQGRDMGVLSPGTWRVGGQDTKHALILAGLGWGSLPAWLVARDLTEGKLARINVAALGPHREVLLGARLAHRIDGLLGPAARALRQALLCCADRPAPPLLTSPTAAMS